MRQHRAAVFLGIVAGGVRARVEDALGEKGVVAVADAAPESNWHRFMREHMLDQAATHQDMENERRIKLLTGILEPAVIVAMGVLVLLIVLAILLPIIEMNQLVRG